MTQSSLQTVAPTAVAALRPGAAVGGQYLVFTLGGEVFAIDILQIREIIEVGEITEVPMTPPTVRGVINLRGAVVPVIDLNARFGHGPSAVGKKTCVVIFDAERDGTRADLGLMVDAVSEVVDIPSDAIEPPPAFGSVVRRDFIRGIGKLGDRFVILLDPEKAFDVEEMAQLCAGAPEHAAA